ncbi:phosphotransferase family protein [Hyphomonas polymorpha]|nr:phosphotransferase family protein [Hyphomonas polymorpha]
MGQSPVPGIDTARIEAWMDTKGLGEGPISSVSQLSGGTQNIIVRFVRGGLTFVLRRPSLTPRAGANEVMAREARVLAALADTNVPHPHLVAVCEDRGVLGATFYLMEDVNGFNAVTGLPELHRSRKDIRHGMGLSMMDAAAGLGRLDHVALGLADFGKPETFLARQAARWMSQLNSYSSHEGWPGPAELGNIQALADYLSANVPPDFRPGIMHGDFVIGNVMFRNDGPELAAVIDWELCTIGDPLLDLAWVIATWRDPAWRNLPVLLVEPWEGFPAIDEMIQHYADRSDRDLSCLDWYIVLACFKLAIILEGSYARACSGTAPKATGEMLHETSVNLIERAHSWLQRPAWH